MEEACNQATTVMYAFTSLFTSRIRYLFCHGRKQHDSLPSGAKAVDDIAPLLFVLHFSATSLGSSYRPLFTDTAAPPMLRAFKLLSVQSLPS